MKRKKLLSYFLSILLVTLMPVSILADTYYIDDGDIIITNNGTQQVTQNSTTKEDNDVTITQHDSNTATDHKIDVETSGNNVATFTIKDINIKPSDGDGIDVDDSNAEINLKGNNTIDASKYNGADSAIHVSSGNLTITSTDNGTLTVDVSDTDVADAVIGSHENESMSGTIRITGNATVKTEAFADGTKGAIIGSGAKTNSSSTSEMSGNIIIDGNAKVDVSNEDDDGAAIGSGKNGDLSGSIIIKGNANVNAEGEEDAAAIGSGKNGDLTGSITVGNNANVKAKSEEGTAIGSGKFGDMSGNITIEDNANVNAESDDGAAIGSGCYNDITETGKIVIKGNAEVVAYSRGDAAAIGSADEGDLSGSITIQDDANVLAKSYKGGAAIGSGLDDDSVENGITETGKIVIKDNAEVVAYAHSNEDYSSSAIGASGKGNMEGTITISGDSEVKTITGENGTAIGTGINRSYSYGQMTGNINILDFATVTTETKTNANVVLNENVDPDTKKTTYTVTYTESNKKGIIGEGNEASHNINRGNFTIGTGVTINNIKGSDIEGLKDYINYYVDADGNPTNIKTVVSIRKNNNNNSNNNTSTVEEVKESKVYKKIDTTETNEDTSTTEETTTIIPNANNETSKTEEVVIDTDQITNTTNNIYLWLIPLFALATITLILSRRRKTNS